MSWMSGGRLAALAIAVVVGVTGVIVVSLNAKSDDAITAEAANYVPSCDGKAMSPGDQCITSTGSSAQTYDQMKADVTPDKLRTSYANRRDFGTAMLIAAALILGSVVTRIVRVKRRARR
jgi:hypothetical protein